jgi:hypothetical protein
MPRDIYNAAGLLRTQLRDLMQHDRVAVDDDEIHVSCEDGESGTQIQIRLPLTAANALVDALDAHEQTTAQADHAKRPAGGA